MEDFFSSDRRLWPEIRNGKRHQRTCGLGAAHGDCVEIRLRNEYEHCIARRLGYFLSAVRRRSDDGRSAAKWHQPTNLRRKPARILSRCAANFRHSGCGRFVSDGLSNFAESSLTLRYGSGFSVEHQLSRAITVPLTYINSRGEDQFLTNDVNAPLPGTHNPNDPTSGVRPLGFSAGNVYAVAVLGSPLFGQSISLASGAFSAQVGNPVANRVTCLVTSFYFWHSPDV